MVQLRSIRPEATPEEVAAIVAAFASMSRAGAVPDEPDDLHEWVRAARHRARRVGLQRGPWRLSGRVGRRARA
jgi:hypothetical protein